jgi:hypothetical protein
MPYCGVAKFVTIRKKNMIDDMPCGYGTLRITAVRSKHQVSSRPAQRSQMLQNLAILKIKYQSILNTPP